MELVRPPGGHASGQVIDERLARRGGGNALLVEYVADEKADAEPLGLPQRGRPPVHRRHLLAALRQRTKKMETDEPARAGDEDLRHARKLPFPKAAFPISLPATPAECYGNAARLPRRGRPRSPAGWHWLCQCEAPLALPFSGGNTGGASATLRQGPATNGSGLKATERQLILNKTAEDRKRRQRENHAIGRRSSPAAAFAITWTYLKCPAKKKSLLPARRGLSVRGSSGH